MAWRFLAVPSRHRTTCRDSRHLWSSSDNAWMPPRGLLIQGFGRMRAERYHRSSRVGRPAFSLVDGSTADRTRQDIMARQTPLDRYRNIGIMAHIDAGK